MKKSMRRLISALVLFLFFFLQILPSLPLSTSTSPFLSSLKKASLFNPPSIDATGLSSSSAILSNPRLSFMGQLSTNYGIAAQTITMTGGGPDTTTANLFAGDYVGIGKTGNTANTNLQVQTVIDATNFTLKTGLLASVSNVGSPADRIYATQSGSLTAEVFTADSIAVGGSIQVVVPLANAPTYSGSNNDGVPDTNATLATSGFDANGITASNIVCPNGFTVGTVTVAPTTLTVNCNWAGAAILAPGADLKVQIGNPGVVGGKALVNPAPVTGHVVGTADIYKISASTWNAANGAAPQVGFVDMNIAPIEGVLVSATVPETLSFRVNTVNVGIGTTCGFTPAGTLVTTTTSSVPFGSVSPGAFYNGAHQLVVSTNSPTGYVVKVDETDQMGLNGVKCVGSIPAAASCILDTTCDGGGTCTESTSAAWTTTGAASDYGLGYSLSQSPGGGTPTLPFLGSVTFNAKQFADSESGETKQTIMSKAGVASIDQACIIYRLDVNPTQTAGTYWNIVRYTASTLF